MIESHAAIVQSLSSSSLPIEFTQSLSLCKHSLSKYHIPTRFNSLWSSLPKPSLSLKKSQSSLQLIEYLAKEYGLFYCQCIQKIIHQISSSTGTSFTSCLFSSIRL